MHQLLGYHHSFKTMCCNEGPTVVLTLFQTNAPNSRDKAGTRSHKKEENTRSRSIHRPTKTTIEFQKVIYHQLHKPSVTAGLQE